MITDRIARFISETEYTDIPEEALIMAKKGILDCIGNCLAGKGNSRRPNHSGLCPGSGRKTRSDGNRSRD